MCIGHICASVYNMFTYSPQHGSTRVFQAIHCTVSPTPLASGTQPICHRAGVYHNIQNKDVSARPTGLRENAERVMSCRGLGPTEKVKSIVYTSSREKEDVATNICPCGTTTEGKPHKVGECEFYKAERNALEEEMRKVYVHGMEDFCCD